MSLSLLLPVIGASLVGSLHCAGMCGPFTAFYAGNDATRGGARAASHAAYHLGRLATYATLGALAGGLGSAADLAGSATGVGRVAAGVSGALMIVWALALLLEHAGVASSWLRAPVALRSVALRVLGRAQTRPPVLRALLVGLASTLLPCGWLWAFAVAAAGTGSAGVGALVMVAFWSGTVPLLLGLGVGMQRLAARLRPHVPVLSAIALLAIGIAGLFGRLNAPALAVRDARSMITAGQLPAEPPCHAKKEPVR
ncbi:MAG: sulfite exporter TauE/SafE family protein [Polyangiaceae bacterium]|nr:sulfite exporter TauE/SafE family protein [Polyangiaceae bacterium]